MVILDQDTSTFHMHLYTPIGGPPSNLKISELQPQRETGTLQRHYLARVIRQMFNLEQTSQAYSVKSDSLKPVSMPKGIARQHLMAQIWR